MSIKHQIFPAISPAYDPFPTIIYLEKNAHASKKHISTNPSTTGPIEVFIEVSNMLCGTNEIGTEVLGGSGTKSAVYNPGTVCKKDMG